MSEFSLFCKNHYITIFCTFQLHNNCSNDHLFSWDPYQSKIYFCVIFNFLLFDIDLNKFVRLNGFHNFPSHKKKFSQIIGNKIKSE